MRHAPDAQHQEPNDLLKASHDTTMASDHCVLAVSQHGRELGTPNCHCATQRIQEAGYQVENVLDNVLLKHWDYDQVQIGQDTVDTDVDAHVEKRAAMMRVAIPDDQECPD